jgi:MucR family transcriptional regulator, transcriptional regulator of exopolysaccharide biosynthesis
VFETILAATNGDAALEAVYNALRMLSHRQLAALHVRDPRTQPANDVDDTIARIIEAIETREQRSIDQLDDRRADRYIIELAELVIERRTRNTADVRSTSRAVLKGLRQELAPWAQAPEPEPAVPIRRSVGKDQVICLICGQKQKLLKRHLATAHDLTPDQYRERFGLRSDYPMVAPGYAKARAEMALRIGLGRPRRRTAGRRIKAAKAAGGRGELTPDEGSNR